MANNAADRKSISAATKRAALADRQRGEILINLMSTVPGREWVWNILDSLHVFGSPIGTDPHHTYFLLGEQNAGKRLMSDAMQWCPDLFIQAMREANGRRTESAIHDSAEPAAGERFDSEEPGRVDQGPSSNPAGGPEVDDDTGEVRWN